MYNQLFKDTDKPSSCVFSIILLPDKVYGSHFRTYPTHGARETIHACVFPVLYFFGSKR